MDWDKNFSKIVKDTEFNLAKVKERLSGAQISESLPELHSSAMKSFTNSTSVGRGFSSLRTPALTSPDVFSKGFQTYDDVSKFEAPASVNPEQSSMITLLHDKIDAQEKTIQGLVQSVKRLEDEKDHYLRQVKELREDLAKLHSRVVERGIDLQTERDMEQWKQEVFSQISALQSQLIHSRRNEANNSTYHGSQTANIVRDIHDLKRFVSSECDGLRYNIEGVKTRLGRIEMDAHCHGSSNRLFGQSQPPVDQFKVQTMQPFLSDQPRIHQQLGSCNGATDISYLKGNIHSLRERLHNVETDFRLASSAKVPDMQKKAPKVSPKTRRMDKNDSFLADLDLDDSVDEDDKIVEDPGELSLDELNDSGDILDDVGSIDLEDVQTANTIDLNLSDDEEPSDLELNDHELSIDELS